MEDLQFQAKLDEQPEEYSKSTASSSVFESIELSGLCDDPTQGPYSSRGRAARNMPPGRVREAVVASEALELGRQHRSRGSRWMVRCRGSLGGGLKMVVYWNVSVLVSV